MAVVRGGMLRRIRNSLDRRAIVVVRVAPLLKVDRSVLDRNEANPYDVARAAADALPPAHSSHVSRRRRTESDRPDFPRAGFGQTWEDR